MTRTGTLDAPTHRTRGWRSLLTLPLVAAVIAAGASPSIAHGLPRFFFPAVALVGGVMATIGVVRASLRLAGGGGQRRANLVGFGAIAVAFVLLAVLPFVRLVGVLTAPSGGAPYILAGFGDWIGGEGYPHPGRHRGIDVKGPVGSDVLAAADGRVVMAREHGDLCGLIIVIVHDPHGYRTVYCHSATLDVRPGDDVRRGQRIATLGTTGQLAWPGYEHVHLELQRGTDRNDLEDPMRRLAGCFDPAAIYPSDRLVLTYPVPCREPVRQ
jgi:murein DD-endopeptidase MepM/ murein hydrolase activator NlpD